MPVFISEVKCSQVLYDQIEKHGGKCVKTRVVWASGYINGGSWMWWKRMNLKRERLREYK